MTFAIARKAAWAAIAASFALVLFSTTRLEYVPAWGPILLGALAIATALRPDAGLLVAGCVLPFAWWLLRMYWNAHASWPEALVVAVALGWSARKSTGRGAPVPSAPGAAAAIFACIALASTIAVVGAERIPLGPAFTSRIAEQLTSAFFVDLRTFPGMHEGLLILEALVLFAAASAVSRADASFAWRFAAAASIGAAIAALANVAQLAHGATEQPAFWPALARNFWHVRYNAHYPDLNAAGSYFVMALIVAVSAAAAIRGRWRGLMVAAAGCAAAGLWISGSRAAMLAGVIGAAGVVVVRAMRRRGRAAGPVLLVGGTALLVVVGLALYLPLRGNQHSSADAVRVRAGMAQAGAQMVARHPLLGIGTGQFYERSGEFVTPELVALFPVATHENAHNNFIQIAAELGLPGLAAFILLLAVALRSASRGTAGDVLQTGLVLASVVFLLTCLGGHPLLIHEAAYAFWLLLGVAAGRHASTERISIPWRIATAIAIVFVLATIPFRLTAMEDDAELEHVGVGVSPWQTAPDGTRYREGTGEVTLFVPSRTAFTLSVQPRTDRPVQLEVRLDGRVANVITIPPGKWSDLTLPARTQLQAERYSALVLRVVDAPTAVLWVTKVRPIQ